MYTEEKDSESSSSSSKDVFDTSMSLIGRAQQNDQQALEALVSVYYPLVKKWCRQGGLKEADVENSTQEVFIKVLRGIADFKKERPDQRFRSWIKRITCNCLVDAARKRERECGVAEGGSGSFFNHVAFNNESDREISRDKVTLYQQALSLVEKKYSKVNLAAFVEYVIHDKPPQVVAEQLGISVNKVYKAKCMVLKELKTEFGDYFN